MENNKLYLCPRNHFQLSSPSQKHLSWKCVNSRSHDLLHMMSFPPEEKTGKTPRLSELFNIKYVRDFKGKVLIDTREYWMNLDGEMKLRKKGICLSPKQWKRLKDQISEIDDVIKRVSAFLSVLSVELIEHVGLLVLSKPIEWFSAKTKMIVSTA
uniref:Activated RNA polymerase II transcriptional coactivator p15 n=1 Tax=Amphiprion percula TaxID=161767 RepID=A0A3P8U582_AMPPE